MKTSYTCRRYTRRQADDIDMIVAVMRRYRSRVRVRLFGHSQKHVRHIGSLATSQKSTSWRTLYFSMKNSHNLKCKPARSLPCKNKRSIRWCLQTFSMSASSEFSSICDVESLLLVLLHRQNAELFVIPNKSNNALSGKNP